MDFQNVHEANSIFKMAVSIGLTEVRILSSDCYNFLINFDQVCGRLHGLIRNSILDSIVYSVVVTFNKLTSGIS